MEHFLLFTIVFLLYFFPTIIAYSRGHRNATGLMWVNLFLGWSVIGWIGALIWSVQIAKSEKVTEVKVELKKEK